MGKKIIGNAAKGAVGIVGDAAKAAITSLLAEVVKEIIMESGKSVTNKKISEKDIMEAGKKVAFDKSTSPTQRMQKEFLKMAIKSQLGI